MYVWSEPWPSLAFAMTGKPNSWINPSESSGSADSAQGRFLLLSVWNVAPLAGSGLDHFFRVDDHPDARLVLDAVRRLRENHQFLLSPSEEDLDLLFQTKGHIESI
jgi:hypothetical protein